MSASQFRLFQLWLLKEKLQPRVHRLALQRQYAKHALMHAPQRLSFYKPITRVNFMVQKGEGGQAIEAAAALD